MGVQADWKDVKMIIHHSCKKARREGRNDLIQAGQRLHFERMDSPYY